MKVLINSMWRSFKNRLIAADPANKKPAHFPGFYWQGNALATLSLC
jgi:hypothetical protein